MYPNRIPKIIELSSGLNLFSINCFIDKNILFDITNISFEFYFLISKTLLFSSVPYIFCVFKYSL